MYVFCNEMYWAFWSCVSSKFLTVWNCQQRRQTEQTKPLTGFQNISKCFCTKITSFYYFCHIVLLRGWQGWPDLWSFYQFRWPPTSAPLGHRHFGLIGSRLINQPCQPPLATASAFFCLIPNSGATYMLCAGVFWPVPHDLSTKRRKKMLRQGRAFSHCKFL